MSRIVAASKKPTWIALGIALALQTGLISLQARRRIDTSFVRVWILDSLAPMEKLVDRSTYSLGYVWKGYVALIGIHDENERLSHQVDELQMQLQRNREDLVELQRLRAMLSLSSSDTGKTVVARVIGRDPARSQTVTIDKGTTRHSLQQFLLDRPIDCRFTECGRRSTPIHTTAGHSARDGGA